MQAQLTQPRHLFDAISTDYTLQTMLATISTYGSHWDWDILLPFASMACCFTSHQSMACCFTCHQSIGLTPNMQLLEWEIMVHIDLAVGYANWHPCTAAMWLTWGLNWRRPMRLRGVHAKKHFNRKAHVNQSRVGDLGQQYLKGPKFLLPHAGSTHIPNPEGLLWGVPYHALWWLEALPLKTEDGKTLVLGLTFQQWVIIQWIIWLVGVTLTQHGCWKPKMVSCWVWLRKWLWVGGWKHQTWPHHPTTTSQPLYFSDNCILSPS